jgi:hypothetical protein
VEVQVGCVEEVGHPSGRLGQNVAGCAAGMSVNVGEHLVGDGVAGRRRRDDQLTGSGATDPAPQDKIDQNCGSSRVIMKPKAG